MRNKSLPQTAIIVIVVISSLHFKTVQAQHIQVVANPDSGDVIDRGIIYNNKLCFGYSDTSGWHLSQYDGTSITIIPNPDAGLYYGLVNVYNNKLYFGYQPEPPYNDRTYLGYYDGVNESIIPPQPVDYNFEGPSVVANNKLYFLNKYPGFFHFWQLAQFDGTNITLISNPYGTVWGPYYPYVYHDSLFTEILTSYPNFAQFVAKVNADSLTLTHNPDTGVGIIKEPMLYNDKLFFIYDNAAHFLQLASYEEGRVTLFPNTMIGKDDSTDASFCIVYKNKLYLAYLNFGSDITQLAQFDGTNLTFIPNPDAGTLPEANSSFIISSFIIYNDKLYFQYKNASGIYQLAQYDGTTVTLIPNPDNGLGYARIFAENVSPFVYHDKLYIDYENQSKVRQLAQYDGNTLTLIPNPDADLDSNKGYMGSPVVYNNKLFFKYAGPSGFSHLAYLDETLPITFLHFYARLKNSDAALQWQTATEENSNRFNIQRSTDGINFYDIGKVKAAGNSVAIHTYNYTDPAVVKLGVPKLFYRLEEVDNDAKTQLSNIVSIDINETIQKITVYPAPAHDVININLPLQLSSNVFIVLYDMNGKIVMQQKHTGNSLQHQLNVNNLAPGNYSLAVIDNGKKLFTKQVIVVH